MSYQDVILRVYSRWLSHAQQTSMEERNWFCVSEIADECARVPGKLEIDTALRSVAIERLRMAVLRGEFDDPERTRSQIVFLHSSPLASIRFEKSWAENAEQWQRWTSYAPGTWNSWESPSKWPVTIWVRRSHCAAWFVREKISPPQDWKLPGTDIHVAGGRPSRAYSSDKFIPIPDQPPVTGKPRMAFDLMLERWPNRKIPKQSSQQIANILKNGLSREDVERALGKRK